MRELDTIQQKEKLNRIYALDEPSNGSANHRYAMYSEQDRMVVGIIQFQRGPRNEKDSISGVLDSELLEIVRDRLEAFQNGEFANEYNENALCHIEQALMWLNKRVEDRINRNVLGTYKK